jgi:hypothetical protein
LLRAGGVLGAAATLPHLAASEAFAAANEIELTGEIGPGDSFQYRYFPFDVPAGVNRLDASIDKSGLSLGFGLFDERGPDYQSPGFRGVYGSEFDAFFLAADAASPSFLPGPIAPGTWTFIVPVFNATRRATVTIRVLLSFGPQGAPFVPGPEVGVVNPEPGWYRGDLHCHTPQSSDAAASGSALPPAQWAQECRRLGLDYAAMTDHNVITQNLNLAADAGAGVLLFPGEEMTNWFHGHSIVCGMEPTQWFDWRQRPAGIATRQYERRITDYLAVARELGAFTSAAHPFIPLPGLRWSFWRDAAADPAALPDAIEVWTGTRFSRASVQEWERQLARGRRVALNGGSDLHGTQNDQGTQVGGPTTVVHAPALEKRALVDALRAGRAFVKRVPEASELYLTATGPDGQATFTGGTLHGAPEQVAAVEVLVRRGALQPGARDVQVKLIRDGQVLVTEPLRLDADEQVVRADVAFAAGGHVRAELEGAHVGLRPGMEALTNPIFLSLDPRPPAALPEHAPPPASTPTGTPGTA